MVLLKKRVQQFQQNHYRLNRELYKQLQKGQNPEVLFITCSDSRVIPNQLLHAKPGELFTIRNAGNLVPAYPDNGGENATIEYALRALNIKQIIVCGHSQCGAMKGLIDPGSTSAMPAVTQWLRHAPDQKALKEKFPAADAQTLLHKAITENVLLQLEHLKQHPCVKNKLANGELTLHGWIYQFESGSVLAYNPDTNDFESLFTEESVQHSSDVSIKPDNRFSFTLSFLTKVALAVSGVLALVALVTMNPFCAAVAGATMTAGLGYHVIKNGFFSSSPKPHSAFNTKESINMPLTSCT